MRIALLRATIRRSIQYKSYSASSAIAPASMAAMGHDTRRASAMVAIAASKKPAPRHGARRYQL